VAPYHAKGYLPDINSSLAADAAADAFKAYWRPNNIKEVKTYGDSTFIFPEVP
jgi:hypothetical protein